MSTPQKLKAALDAAKRQGPPDFKADHDSVPVSSGSGPDSGLVSPQSALPPHPPGPPRDARGRILPGYSGNPGGRPKGITALAREALEQINDWQVLVDLASNEDTADQLRFEIIRYLQDRVYGKAVTVSAHAELKPEQLEGLIDVGELPPEAQLDVLKVSRRFAELEAKRQLAPPDAVLLAQQAEPSAEGK